MPAWNYIFKIVKTRLKDLGINFISIGLEIAGICFQDICSIFVELCLQDAQIALLHFTRLCCSNNGVNSIIQSLLLLLHHPWQECENIHPSLSSPTSWENLWSEVTTTAALEIGNLNTSPGIHPQSSYNIHRDSFYQYQPEEIASWTRKSSQYKWPDIFYWFVLIVLVLFCDSPCLELAGRACCSPGTICASAQSDWARALGDVLASPSLALSTPVQPPACLRVPPVSRGQLWAKFEVN